MRYKSATILETHARLLNVHMEAHFDHNIIQIHDNVPWDYNIPQ